MDWSGRIVANRSGREWSDWSAELVIPGSELRWRFCSDGSVNGWGWKFTVYPIVLSEQKSLFSELENVSDRAVISRPSIALVVSLLNSEQVLLTNAKKATVLRLAAALASCAQLNYLSPSQRMWVLEKLRQLVTSTAGQRLKIMAQSPTSPTTTLLPQDELGLHGSMALSLLLKHLPEMLLRQFEYEDPLVRAGKHLMHTQFFKVLVALACDLELDVARATEGHRWIWFKRFCMTSRVAQALIQRTPLPLCFCDEVKRKLRELFPDEVFDEKEYENNVVFKQEQVRFSSSG